MTAIAVAKISGATCFFLKKKREISGLTAGFNRLLLKCVA